MICREIAGGEKFNFAPSAGAESPVADLLAHVAQTARILADLAPLLRPSYLAAKLNGNVQGPDSVSTSRCFVSPVQPRPGLLGLFLAAWFFMWAASKGSY